MNSKLRFPILAVVAMILCAVVWIGWAQQPNKETLARGKALYDARCAVCHGADGKGDGAAATYLYPKPRDFTAGQFKVRSTPSGQLPTDEDLMAVLTRGTPGRSMPSFAGLSEADRTALVQYVKHLTAYTNEKGERVNRFEEALKSGNPPTPIKVGAEIPATPQSIAKGKAIYASQGCAKCHGETGKGDGPSARALRDNWGFPIIVRDFTSGDYLGGSTDRDLYLRFTTGMSGTPMPAYSEDLTDEQRWQLVHYVQSLLVKQPKELATPKDGVIRASRVRGKINDDPNAAAWDTVPPVELPLLSLWQRGVAPASLLVRAQHDGTQLALLLEWEDTATDLTAIRKEDFRDGCAVQFAMGAGGKPIARGGEPSFTMGEKGKPVNIWHWKADWQEEATGKRADVDTMHPQMHVDMYDRKEPMFQTADAAKNLLAAQTRKSPIEDMNAEGFGTLKTQSAQQQNVFGRGVWANGKWRVVFVRELKSREAEDAQFVVGQQIPVAFAVWDGQYRDRNGQKLVTDWFWLELAR